MTLAGHSPADLRELASVLELNLANEADRDAHRAALEAIGANADPATSEALDRIAALRALPEEWREVVDVVVPIASDSVAWATRAAMFEAQRFTTDLRAIVQGGLDLAAELGMDQATAIAVCSAAARDLRVRGLAPIPFT